MSWSHGLYNVVRPAADRISIANHSVRGKNGAHANIDFSRTISFLDPNFMLFKQLNNTEAAIYATPIIGSTHNPFPYNVTPPLNFWIDNYSTILGSGGSRICTSNFEFLWKWGVGTTNDEKYADCLANPDGLQGSCANRVTRISARILDETYEATGFCYGASLESLPKRVPYFCKLDPTLELGPYNPVLNYQESVLIFNNVSNTIKFIESIEKTIKKTKEPEQADWTDLPF